MAPAKKPTTQATLSKSPSGKLGYSKKRPAKSETAATAAKALKKGGIKNEPCTSTFSYWYVFSPIDAGKSLLKQAKQAKQPAAQQSRGKRTRSASREAVLVGAAMEEEEENAFYAETKSGDEYSDDDEIEHLEDKEEEEMEASDESDEEEDEETSEEDSEDESSEDEDENPNSGPTEHSTKVHSSKYHMLRSGLSKQYKSKKLLATERAGEVHAVGRNLFTVPETSYFIPYDFNPRKKCTKEQANKKHQVLVAREYFWEPTNSYKSKIFGATWQEWEQLLPLLDFNVRLLKEKEEAEKPQTILKKRAAALTGKNKKTNKNKK